MHLNRDGVKNGGPVITWLVIGLIFFPALLFAPSLILAVDPWTWCMDSMQLAFIDKLRYNLLHSVIAEA